MPNDLTVFENQLKPLAPRFEAVLGGIMPVDRLTQTAIICVERNPKLLECNRQTLFNACLTFATLGLEIDGATGQGFIIPFGSTAQPVIGYKGYATLAARAGYTITGDVIREGDDYDYQLGTDAFIHHKPKLGGGTDRRIIAAYATATSKDRPPIIELLDIDDLLAVKAKSPGAKKKDSPWNDPRVGFPAMCAKTAKRRLARHMPLNVMQLAATMDQAHEELGQTAHIDPDRGVVIDGKATVMPERDQVQPDLLGDPPVWEVVTDVGVTQNLKNKSAWTAYMKKAISSATDVAQLNDRIQSNRQIINALKKTGEEDIAEAIISEASAKKTELMNKI